jgi:hypothetical protein
MQACLVPNIAWWERDNGVVRAEAACYTDQQSRMMEAQESFDVVLMLDTDNVD